MASIELQSLVKRWGPFVGVDHIDLDIADQEFLVLLGPSGCGKTTTMRMVAGLEDVSSGEIRIGGRRVNEVEPKDRDIAMVFQSYGLYAHLTVYDNIRFPLRVRGVPQREHDARIRKAAKMVELEGLLDRKPRALSGGQRQRVALARAIVREPTCFLMDEPLSNLDAKLRVSTRAEIKHLQHTLATTTIYVTHDQVEAMTLAHRVAVMERGRIKQLGTPEEIYNRPANVFVAGFIGSPAMNLVPGSVEGGVFHGDGLTVPMPGAPDLPEAVLGTRAEDMQIVDPSDATVAQQVYSMELLGDSTLVTVKLGAVLFSVKGGKDYRVGIGETVGFRLEPSQLHLFDGRTGDRVAMEGIRT
jgi:multiple sugar transport system ATP-binding protein